MFPWQSARVWDTAPGLPRCVSLLNHRQELRIPGSQGTGRSRLWRTELLLPPGIIAAIIPDLRKWKTHSTMERERRAEGGRKRERQRGVRGRDCMFQRRKPLVTFMALNWEFVNITVYICRISEQKLKRVREYLYMGPLFITVKGQNKN